MGCNCKKKKGNGGGQPPHVSGNARDVGQRRGVWKQSDRRKKLNMLKRIWEESKTES